MLHATYVYTDPAPRRRLACVRHARGPLTDEDVERFLAAEADLPSVYVRRDLALIPVLCTDGRAVVVTSELEGEVEAAEHARRVLGVPFDAGRERHPRRRAPAPRLTLHAPPPEPRSRRRLFAAVAVAAVCASCAVGLVLAGLAFSQSGGWS